jgi:polyhydroxyalkanoate synthase
VRFVLGGSGHIAGIVNPPAAGKYWYWTNDALRDTAEQWLQTASKQPGSWWPDWAGWIAAFGGGQVPARQPGDGSLPVIEDAPGSYARLRLDQPAAGHGRKPNSAPENRSRKKPAAVRPLRRSSGN